MFLDLLLVWDLVLILSSIFVLVLVLCQMYFCLNQPGPVFV